MGSDLSFEDLTNRNKEDYDYKIISSEDKNVVIKTVNIIATNWKVLQKSKALTANILLG